LSFMIQFSSAHRAANVGCENLTSRNLGQLSGAAV
jgi:hypothetical protein